MHEGQPVGEEGPAGQSVSRGAIANLERPRPPGAMPALNPSPRGPPVVIHVLNLAFDIAVDPLAVSAVG